MFIYFRLIYRFISEDTSIFLIALFHISTFDKTFEQTKASQTLQIQTSTTMGDVKVEN